MQWAGETARFHPGDMRHACSMASSSAYLLWIQFGSTKEDIPVVSRLAVLRSIYDQIDLHMQQWFPLDPSESSRDALIRQRTLQRKRAEDPEVVRPESPHQNPV